MTGAPIVLGTISAVFVADCEMDRVRLSLAATKASIETARARGYGVSLILVNRTNDEDIDALLRSAGGDRLISVGPATGAGTYWKAAAETNESDTLWLCSSESMPGPSTLFDLAQEIDTDRSTALALPKTQWAPGCLVRRTALEQLGGTENLGMSPGARPLFAVDALRRACTKGSLGFTVVQNAADEPTPMAPTKRVLRNGDTKATISSPRPQNITVGINTYFGNNCRIDTMSPHESVHIGNYCSFAHDIRILRPPPQSRQYADAVGTERSLRPRDGHYSDFAANYNMGRILPHVAYDDIPDAARSRPLVIGNDVWVGNDCLIVGGVTIGDGAILGAGSVVASDVPPYAVVTGNRAEIVKYRFSEETREALLKIAWWDWPVDEVMRQGEWFYRPIDEFVAQFAP